LTEVWSRVCGPAFFAHPVYPKMHNWTETADNATKYWNWHARRQHQRVTYNCNLVAIRYILPVLWITSCLHEHYNVYFIRLLAVYARKRKAGGGKKRTPCVKATGQNLRGPNHTRRKRRRNVVLTRNRYNRECGVNATTTAHDRRANDPDFRFRATWRRDPVVTIARSRDYDVTRRDEDGATNVTSEA